MNWLCSAFFYEFELKASALMDDNVKTVELSDVELLNLKNCDVIFNRANQNRQVHRFNISLAGRNCCLCLQVHFNFSFFKVLITKLIRKFN